MAPRNFSKLDSYALMIIALSAVFVSVWQVNLQRKHDRITVKPYLAWIMAMDEEGFTSLRIKNKGFGPAFFERGVLEIQDSTFRDWRKALTLKDSSIQVNRSSSLGRFTLLPGEEFLLVSAKGGKEILELTYRVYFKDAYDGDYEDYYTYSGRIFN